MKITLERLREIVTEEVIKESVSPEDAQRTIVALLQGTPPNVTGDIMGAVYDEMYDADVSEPSAEPEEEEDFPTEYQGGGAYGDRPTMGFKENMNEVIQEEYYIYLIEQELKFRTLTEAKEHLFTRLSPGEKADLFTLAQRHKDSKEAKVWLKDRLTVTTDIDKLRDAEEQGLAKLVYQMSNPGRQYLFDMGRSISNVQPEQLAAQDERYGEQAKHGAKPPLTTEPVRTYKTSASDQPASTSGQLSWFLNRWRQFIDQSNPEDFRAEVDRSKEYLPDGKSIIEYLEAFLSMLRNRYQHDYQTA
tara:strand:+ start:239 stop:1147 length:909 start_codon:yes stop_codon:yes gene_type:complete